MSQFIARTASNAAKKFLNTGRLIPSSFQYSKSLVYSDIQTLQANRTLTRSLWHMSRKPVSSKQTTQSSFSKTCGCCEVHTQDVPARSKSDQNLAEFLADEIKIEKESEKNPEGKLPKIQGFDVETDGTDVILTKVNNGETVKVKFNVNNSVDDESPMEFDEAQQEQQSEMVAKPPFIVEINKGGRFTLAVQCVFPPADDIPPPAEEGGQQYEDLIEISEVALIEKEWDDKAYTLAGSIMDGNMYAMVLNMLEERGIDSNFVDQLVDFSTSYEHRKYISFLEQLKDFVAK